MNLNILLYEFHHFIKNKAKLFSFIFFMAICVFSIYNGIVISNSQTNTIEDITNKVTKEHVKVIEWFENGDKGPEDRSWVNIEDPFWSIRYTPTYVFKYPSPLLPLGIGQTKQFGFYKKINRWSSTYDTDIVQEISNYERLINGDIDFSFLIIFLLPILIIILTYNINGLEIDLGIHKLISIQHKNVKIWLVNRMLFYFILVIVSIDLLILLVGLLNIGVYNHPTIFQIILISNIYILIYFLIFYFLNIYTKNSSNTAFKMISIWLLFCVIIPGSVHQYVNYKYPANYMVDFLDVNRKQTYDVFKLENSELFDMLYEIHPSISKEKDLEDLTSNKQNIRRSISSIVNQMNINAAYEIEKQNEAKNNLIRSTYLFNPISFIQNTWNSYTNSDYYAYKDFRIKIQESINARNNLMIDDLWSGKKVDSETYKEYLKVLN
ncbi:MAG: hypothetical protein CMP51_00805 [Flavobacteriales bacterium]|nr:hypothetical protein [Flavobacteriales bacterium]